MEKQKQLIYVNLKVKSQDGNEVYFNVIRSNELRRVMIVACSRLSLEINDICFMFEGRRVLPEQSPDELMIKDGDVIDALPCQQPLTEVDTRQDDNIPSTTPSSRINIKIWAPDRSTVFCKIKRHKQLSKLMIAYCEHRSMGIDAFAFLFNGRRLRPEDTADKWGMKDGDEIDAMPHLHG